MWYGKPFAWAPGTYINRVSRVTFCLPLKPPSVANNSLAEKSRLGTEPTTARMTGLRIRPEITLSSQRDGPRRFCNVLTILYDISVGNEGDKKAVRPEDCGCTLTAPVLYASCYMEAKDQATGTDRQLFYNAFGASPVGVALEDMEGRPLYVNPALCSMLGFSEEELLKKHCVDFSPPEDAEKDWALFQQLKSGCINHYSVDKRYFRRDGSLVWGRLSISLLRDSASPMVVAMVVDITENKKAQEAMLRAQHDLDIVTREASVAAARCSRDFRYL